MANNYCSCCLVVNKLSRIDYLDLETFPVTLPAKKSSTTKKTCYRNFSSNFSSLLLPDWKPAGKLAKDEPACATCQDNKELKKGKSKISGEEAKQHICQICRNSETVKVNENCLFEKFDDFAHHMSRRHNTSVIRLTPKPTRFNHLSEETGTSVKPVKVFNMPSEVPLCKKAAAPAKNSDEMFLGQGTQSMCKPMPNISVSSSSGITLLNGHSNSKCSLSSGVNNVPHSRKGLLLEEKGCNYRDVQSHSVEDMAARYNVVQRMKHFVGDNNERYSAPEKDSWNSATSGLPKIQLHDSFQKIAAPYTSETVSQHQLKLYGDKANFQKSNLQSKEHLEVKKLVSHVESVLEREMRGQNSASGHPPQVTLKSRIIRDNNIHANNYVPVITTVASQMGKKFDSTYKNSNINSISNNHNHIDYSANKINLKPRNKRFLSDYDIKQPSCMDGFQKIPIESQLKCMNTNNTSDLSKPLTIELSPFSKDRSKSLDDIKVFSSASDGRLVSSTNYSKMEFGDKEDNLLLKIANQFPVDSTGSVKRKRGRPPKKGLNLSLQNNMVLDSLEKTGSKHYGETLLTNSSRNDTHNNCDDMIAKKGQQPTDEEGKNIDPAGETIDINIPLNGFIQKNCSTSETTAQLLHKHIINRKMCNETSNSTRKQKQEQIATNSTNKTLKHSHTPPSRLSDRLKNNHILIKQRSEHLKKVEFLSRLGLVETSVLPYLLEKKCNNKNRSLKAKSTKSNVNNIFSLNNLPKQNEVSLVGNDKIEPPPKRRRGRPKKIPTTLQEEQEEAEMEEPEIALPSFIPVYNKEESQSHSSTGRSTGRARKTSQKYSDYVCYY